MKSFYFLRVYLSLCVFPIGQFLLSKALLTGVLSASVNMALNNNILYRLVLQSVWVHYRLQPNHGHIQANHLSNRDICICIPRIQTPCNSYLDNIRSPFRVSMLGKLYQFHQTLMWPYFHNIFTMAISQLQLKYALTLFRAGEGG